MNENKHQITSEDAKAALESIETANRVAIKYIRPPFWLLMLGSISLAALTPAMALMIENLLWHGIRAVSFITLWLCVVYWIYELRRKGVLNVYITKKGIIATVLICIIPVISRAIYLKTGSEILPYIAGVLNAIIFSFSLLQGRLSSSNSKGKFDE